MNFIVILILKLYRLVHYNIFLYICPYIGIVVKNEINHNIDCISRVYICKYRNIIILIMKYSIYIYILPTVD